MSQFEVLVTRIDSVEDHPDADRLSLNKIGGYVAVSNKTPLLDQGQHENDVEWAHRYQAGQLVVYVPEGAVVPLEILQRYGYTDADGNGILAGSKGNRVKAVKLRGVVSQGLIFPLERLPLGDFNELLLPLDPNRDRVYVNEGDNVAELLGITKYEPAIPTTMSGDVVYYPQLTLKFDLENIQKYGKIFEDDETVYATEKLHGTFCGMVFVTETFVVNNQIDPEMLIPFGDHFYATAYSKGLGGQGLVFQNSPQAVKSNIYLRALTELLADESVRNFIEDQTEYLGKFTMLGEVYGKGVQDLMYGLDTSKFAAFNFVSSDGNYMSANSFWDYAADMTCGPCPGYMFPPTVPLVFEGTYKELVDNIAEYRDGKSKIDGKTIREGIVIVPAVESRDERIGRRALKAVSPDYLTRKNGTEYN